MKISPKFIKTVLPKKVQSELQIHILNKHTDDNELSELSKLLEGSEPIGILSEAGLPVVADPGARLVRLAHKKYSDHSAGRPVVNTFGIDGVGYERSAVQFSRISANR